MELLVNRKKVYIISNNLIGYNIYLTSPNQFAPPPTLSYRDSDVEPDSKMAHIKLRRQSR